MSDLPPPSPSDVPPPPSPLVPPVEAAPQPPVVQPLESSTGTPPMGDVPLTTPTPKDSEEKTLGLVMHLLPLSGLLTAVHIPLLNLIAPGILWFVKKDKSPYLDAVGKEVLNFQISVTLAGLVCVLLIPLFCVGLVLGIALMVVFVYYIVMAAIAANKGEFYRFPYCLRLIK